MSILAIMLGLVWTTSPYIYNGHTGCKECHSLHYEAEGACIDCHRGNPGTNRVEVAHHLLIAGKYAYFTLQESSVVKDGYRLIMELGCRRCHRAGERGNSLASNLDRVLPEKRPEELAAAIKAPVMFMPNFYLPEPYIIKLVNAILDSAFGTEQEFYDNSLVVHFDIDKETGKNPFVIHCGSCHRVLTKQLGGIGRGDIGPNLSGLLTEFYPQNYKDTKSWNSEGLKKWLNNPRGLRDNTIMTPVKLTENEYLLLLRIFQDRAEN